MLCKHCGYPLEENMAFCQKCGARVEKTQEQAVPVQETQETPVEETVRLEATPLQENAQPEVVINPEAVSAEPVFAEPEFAKPESEEDQKTKKKKSRKRGWIITGIVAGVLAVAVAVCLIFFPGVVNRVKGWTVKTLGSNDDYLEFVEKQATQKLVDDAVDAYGKYLNRLENIDTYETVDTSMQLELSDKATTLLKENVDEDLAWLDSLTVNIDANRKGKAKEFLYTASLNGSQFVQSNKILDFEDAVQYLAILTLDNEYLKEDVYYYGYGLILQWLTDPELKNYLPEETVVAELVRKYTTLIYDGLKNAEMSTESVTVEGVQQKLTVLKVKLSFQEAKQIAKNVLETLEDDDVVKNIIMDLADYLESKDEDIDADELYDEFLEGIDDLQDDLNATSADDAFEDMWISFYVNGSHEIVGKKYKVDSEWVQYVTVRDGEKFGCMLDADYAKITGSGTEKDDVVTGEFILDVDGKKWGTISVQEFSVKDDLLNGKVTVTPSDYLLTDMLDLDASVSSVLTVLSPSVEFVFESQPGNTKAVVNLIGGTENLATVTITSVQKEPTDVSMPSDDRVVTDMWAYEWLYSKDMSPIEEKLIAAGAPEDMAESLVHMIVRFFL